MLKRFLLSLLLLMAVACLFAQQPARLLYKNYSINRSLKGDSSLVQMLQPYTDSLHRWMNTVIGFSNTALYKKQPESALGNLMADGLKIYAERIYETDIDAAILNYGGIRSFIPKGEITLQTVYDLVPFDNHVVLLHLNGNTLHQLLDLSAYKGGWPVAGVFMKIKNKAAADIVINNSPLQDTAIYTIAVFDYMANGGDGCSMLKGIAQQNKNYLYRDALLHYIKAFTSSGKPVSATLQNRVTKADE